MGVVSCVLLSVKLTVTVMITGTGTPFSSVGSNFHLLDGRYRRRVKYSGMRPSTLADRTSPALSMTTTSRMTTPWTFAPMASGG